MKISKVVGREIFDSRGIPTVMCELTLEDGSFVEASVPSGASCGSKEAFELRDGGDRLMGQGVLKAIHNIEHKIGPAIIGEEPDVAELDHIIRDLDPTSNKRELGANATLAVSIAICKAQAVVNQLEIFELISALYDIESVSLPFPLFNVINGGAHANNNYPIQEIMLVPVGAQNFRASIEAAVTVFHHLKKSLQEKNMSTSVGDEGGFSPVFSSLEQPFDLLMESIAATKNDGMFTIALDVAASQFYDVDSGIYHWNGKEKTTDEMIQIYQKLSEKYPIYSIEDGLAETDWQGWKLMYHDLGEPMQIVGDDIFATNEQLITRGVNEGVANAAIIKPNQIGTLTETLDAMKLCHDNDMNVIVSHRSGETTDTFISDLAVGTQAGQIKAGGCSRGERIAKYNRLLYIEDLLTMAQLG
jgi:enolase